MKGLHEGIMDSFQMNWENVVNNYGSLDDYLAYDLEGANPSGYTTVKMDADKWNELVRINE